MIRARPLLPLALAALVAPGIASAEEASPGITVRGTPPAKPASDKTIDRPVLEAAPHRTASDLLVTVPGFSVSQHGGEGKAHQLFFRGFDAVHGQDVELWAGGLPVNDVSNLHGQGYADLHFMPPEVVRRVRAAPGSYDVRQGDFAVAGTVRFDLGLDHPGASAKVGYGSFGTRRLLLTMRPPGNETRTFAAFEAYTTDGFGPSRAAQRASGLAQGVVPLGDFAEARVLATTYAGHYDSAGVVLLRDLETRRIGTFDTYDPRQGGSSTRHGLVVELTSQEPESKVRWSLSPYVVLRSLALRSNYTGYLDDPKDGDSIQQLHRATTFGFQGHHRFEAPVVSKRDRLEIGIGARSDAFRQSQNRLASVDSRVTKAEVAATGRWTDVTGWVEHTSHPHERVSLRAGLRVDGLSSQVEDKGIGRAAQGTHVGRKAVATVRAASGTTLSASYGEGFRSPQARSLGDGERTPFTTVTSYEVGARTATSRAAAGLTVFRTVLSDDLVFDQATGRNERVPGTTRTGATVDADLRPTPTLVAALSFTYTRAVFRETAGTVTEGSLLPYAPQMVGRVDLSYRPHLGTLRGRSLDGRVGYGLGYIGRRPLLFGEMGHDILLADASAALRLDRIEVGLDVYNAFDARWFDGEFAFASRWDPSKQSTLTPTRHVTVGPPRALMLSVTLSTEP